MQKKSGQILYSASDIANFLECEHLTTLDALHLESPMQKTEAGEDAVLIQKKGYKHEAAYFAKLQSEYAHVVNIHDVASDLESRVVATIEALQSGADIIFQAAFAKDNLIGHADFLKKVALPSKLGDYSYEVMDTKLSGTTHAKFLIQLCFYSKLLADIQGVHPREMHVVLGNNNMQASTYQCSDYTAYFDELLSRFFEQVSASANTYPNPCNKCDLCHWSDRCIAQRVDDDHLCQVAGILKSQINKLNAAGIQTMQDLATTPDTTTIPKLNIASFQRIQQQASLQYQFRVNGQPTVVLLPLDEDKKRGFARLPQPDIGDLYFDMEGNPLEDDGKLEYLFGLYYMENAQAVFKPFWALQRSAEKAAFEAFMDFVMAHLQKYPNAHIYHYASYEETALKHLMSTYGTREHAVDTLLRDGKLIDLYKVVRESIRTSEPGYSIKNIEHFYLEKRQSEVTNAGASIIYFEKWKATQDQKYLDDISLYNEDDVRSTMELHRWLLKQRPAEIEWANQAFEVEATEELPITPASALREMELARYRRLLLGDAEIADEDKSPEYLVNELVFQLMDFHRREAKPAWWNYFKRVTMSTEELIEDSECISGLALDPRFETEPVKRSLRYHFTFPPQETKLYSGSQAVIVETGASVSNLEVNPVDCTLSFTIGNKAELPERLVLGPTKPIDAKQQINAIKRYVDARLSANNPYKAIDALLAKDLPKITCRENDEPLIQPGQPIADGAIEVISAMDNSYLVVQGPPGTGKTFTGSKVIVELLKAGHRVGITSNSHKAINNLLLGVDKEAVRVGFSFNGVKKVGDADDELADCVNVQTVTANDAALSEEFNLIAGTAWLFSHELADQQLDYLFVDEAGQVALGNLVAIGTSSRNVVLLGDQMQLGQPTQGVHPGCSGQSALEFLLEGKHTVAPDRGIFLGVSYRMHPTICKFISDTVYDGRLNSDEFAVNQVLRLTDNAHPALRTNGLVYLPIVHQDCTQSSDEEAALIKILLTSLLEQSYVNRDNELHALTLNDILVVTPYNLQVQKLKSTLPEGSRIGTVDKFQGQEAPVVIFSMVTSSGEDLPRDIEFLYSKNRLNVAISRAQALALFIANPKLKTIQCKTPEQMALVNTLCRVTDYH